MKENLITDSRSSEHFHCLSWLEIADSKAESEAK